MSRLQLRFVQVDVFTDRPLMGNAVAVVLDGAALEDEQMQAMAHCKGRELGRDGRVSVIVQGGEVEIGGRCVTVIEGVANL